MTMIYQQDMVKLDSERITDETHPVFGDMTVFHDVVIASEIVQPYEDGMAWKPRDELESYAWTVDGRWVMVGGHPADGIISERDQVAGRTVNPRYVKDLKDPKTKRPNRAGVRADIQIFNNKVSPQLLADMKTGKKPDVSIGFFFNKDNEPGVVESDSCKGEEYDYVQRNMFHDHLAAAIDNGRCTMPYCGLGADEIIKKFVGDPFAGFENFAACMAHMTKPKSEGGEGYTEEQAQQVCGKLKSEHEDRVMEETLLGKSKEHLLLLLEDAFEELRGTVLAKKEQAEGDWWRRINWSEDDNRTLFDALKDETKTLIIEAGLCPDCQQEDMGEGGCPEGTEWNEEKATCLPVDETDVKESNPGFDPGEAEEECPEGMEWNAEQGKCVEIADFSDRPENKKVDASEIIARFEKAKSK